MADFDQAVELVLKHEGGYSPGLSGDPGGETNFGIAKASHPELVIKDLTKEEAKAIYLKEYWKPYMEQEPDQKLASCALDCSVNQGPTAASQIYLLCNPDLKCFQTHRLIRYALSGKTQFYKSWFGRVLDV